MLGRACGFLDQTFQSLSKCSWETKLTNCPMLLRSQAKQRNQSLLKKTPQFLGPVECPGIENHYKPSRPVLVKGSHVIPIDTHDINCIRLSQGAAIFTWLAFAVHLWQLHGRSWQRMAVATYGESWTIGSCNIRTRPVCLKMGYTHLHGHFNGVIMINQWIEGSLFSDKPRYANSLESNQNFELRTQCDAKEIHHARTLPWITRTHFLTPHQVNQMKQQLWSFWSSDSAFLSTVAGC